MVVNLKESGLSPEIRNSLESSIEDTIRFFDEKYGIHEILLQRDPEKDTSRPLWVDRRDEGQDVSKMIWKNYWAEVEGDPYGLVRFEYLPQVSRDPSDLAMLCDSDLFGDRQMQGYHNLFVGAYAERCLAVPDSDLFPGLRTFFGQLFDHMLDSPVALAVLESLSQLPAGLGDAFISNHLAFMAGVGYAEHLILSRREYEKEDLLDTPQISPDKLITDGEYVAVHVCKNGVKAFRTYDEFLKEKLSEISLLPISKKDLRILENVGQAFVEYVVENGVAELDNTFRTLYTDAIWRSMRLAHADPAATGIDLMLPFERADFLRHRFYRGESSNGILRDFTVSTHNHDILEILKILGYQSSLDPFSVILSLGVLEKVDENPDAIDGYILMNVKKFKDGKTSFVELERSFTDLYESLHREMPWDKLEEFLSCKSVNLPDYDVRRRIAVGKGAHKKVFEATHIPTGETRIVKLLSPTKIGADSLKDRGFSLTRLAQREYSMASGRNFDDEHLSKIHDIIFSDGAIYIIEEPYDETLADVLSRENMPERHTAIRYACELTSVLVECHNMMDIAHGDLKPDNIGLKDGKVKLSDFGIAATIGSEDEIFATGSTRMKAPELLGTQLQPTEQSDVWAVGVLMYRMLSGEFPFHYRKLSNWDERISYEHEIKVDIYDKLDNPEKKSDFLARCGITEDDLLWGILDQCLSTDPQVRYANCLPLLQDLQAEVERMKRSEQSDEYAVFERTFQEETGYATNDFLNVLGSGGVPGTRPEGFAPIKRFVYATLKSTGDSQTKETCHNLLMSISKFRLRNNSQ